MQPVCWLDTDHPPTEGKGEKSTGLAAAPQPFSLAAFEVKVKEGWILVSHICIFHAGRLECTSVHA